MKAPINCKASDNFSSKIIAEATPAETNLKAIMVLTIGAPKNLIDDICNKFPNNKIPPAKTVKMIHPAGDRFFQGPQSSSKKMLKIDATRTIGAVKKNNNSSPETLCSAVVFLINIMYKAIFLC